MVISQNRRWWKETASKLQELLKRILSTGIHSQWKVLVDITVQYRLGARRLVLYLKLHKHIQTDFNTVQLRYTFVNFFSFFSFTSLSVSLLECFYRIATGNVIPLQRGVGMP